MPEQGSSAHPSSFPLVVFFGMQILISQEMVGKIKKINKWCFMNCMHLKKLAYDIVGFCMIA